jgi:predicted regulator of Ras-like GTPase activity (Roadblock/LC7/MglB family)
MKRVDLARLIGALRDPVQRFVRDSRVRIVLLVNGAGQVLAQHGFASSFEVMNVASLAAATHASSRVLAEISGAERWEHLYHGGREHQLFLAPLRTPGEELILVAIFDHDSSLGIVRLFYDELEARVAALGELRAPTASSDQSSFEHDLAAGLEFISEGSEG